MSEQWHQLFELNDGETENKIFNHRQITSVLHLGFRHPFHHFFLVHHCCLPNLNLNNNKLIEYIFF